MVGPSEVDVWSTSHDPLSPYHHHHHHQHAAYYGPVSSKRLLCVVLVLTSTLVHSTVGGKRSGYDGIVDAATSATSVLP